MAVPLHPEPARHADFQVRSLWQYLALAALTALLLALAFPEPGWGILAHIALVPMTWLARHAERRWRLAWITYLVSFAWWLVMIRWLIPITGGGFAGLAAYMAVYWPAYAIVWRAIDRKFRWPAAITVPMVWVSLEYLRGTILQGGFGWYALSHSQAPYEPGDGGSAIIQVAEFAGEWTVSFVVAMTSGAILDASQMLASSRHSPRAGRIRRWTGPIVWAAGLGAALAWGMFQLGYGDMTKAMPARVRIAIVQTSVTQDNKTNATPQQQANDWHRLVELINMAAEPKAMAEGEKPRRPDLIALPETMVPFPLNTEVNVELLRLIRVREMDAEKSALRFHNQLSTLAFDLQTNLFVGAARWLPDPQKAQPLPPEETWLMKPSLRWNSAYLYQADGTQSTQRFDKIHRVPFGEYIPWVEDWPWLKALFLKYLSPYGEGNDYTLQKGEAYTVFDVQLPRGIGEEARVLRVATPICFEDTLARACRPMVYDSDGNKRADLLINLTNDGWFGTDSERTAHFQIAVLRCVENRVPMVRSVNMGVSGFIDSSGRVGPFVEVDGKLQHVDGAAVADVAIDNRATVFGYVGQIPVISLTCVTGLLFLVALVRRGSAL